MIISLLCASVQIHMVPSGALGPRGQVQPRVNKARGLGENLPDPIHVSLLVPLNVPVLWLSMSSRIDKPFPNHASSVCCPVPVLVLVLVVIPCLHLWIVVHVLSILLLFPFICVCHQVDDRGGT